MKVVATKNPKGSDKKTLDKICPTGQETKNNQNEFHVMLLIFAGTSVELPVGSRSFFHDNLFHA